MVVCVGVCVKRGRRRNASNGSNGHGPVEAGLVDDAAGGWGVEPGRNGRNGSVTEPPAADFPTEEDAANMLSEMLSQGVEPGRNGRNGPADEGRAVTHAQDEEEDAANMLAGMLSKLQRFRWGGRAGAGGAGAAGARETSADVSAVSHVGLREGMSHVGLREGGGAAGAREAVDVDEMSHVGLREQHADKRAVQAEKA